jgi:hypothetical protein
MYYKWTSKSKMSTNDITKILSAVSEISKMIFEIYRRIGIFVEKGLASQLV